MKGKVRYLIKWAVWPSEYNQWVEEKDLDGAQEAIKDFEKSNKRKKSQTSSLFSSGKT